MHSLTLLLEFKITSGNLLKFKTIAAGRAAQRLQEVVKVAEASTVHRLLGYRGMRKDEEEDSDESSQDGDGASVAASNDQEDAELDDELELDKFCKYSR